jgi:hypothetical protein
VQLVAAQKAKNVLSSSPATVELRIKGIISVIADTSKPIINMLTAAVKKMRNTRVWMGASGPGGDSI